MSEIYNKPVENIFYRSIIEEKSNDLIYKSNSEIIRWNTMTHGDTTLELLSPMFGGEKEPHSDINGERLIGSMVSIAENTLPGVGSINSAYKAMDADRGGQERILELIASSPLPNVVDKVLVGTLIGTVGSGFKLVRKFFGHNWRFNPHVDVDLTAPEHSFKGALRVAFDRAGEPRDSFEIIQYGHDRYGKEIPVEYKAPNGAKVSIDIPELNNVRRDGTFGDGPQQPHIGYQTSGKGSERVRGHIFSDKITATRR